MEKKFEYRGDLAATPLAEILATIHRYRVPGVVSLSREGRRRRIHIADGLVVFATSNEKEVSLGMHLLKRGIVNADLAREADDRRERDGLRLGQVLLEMGVLTPEELNFAVSEQIREILWGAFDWEDGQVVFELGSPRVGELVRIDLPIAEVIREGIRRTGNVRRFVQRMGSSGTLLEKTHSALPEFFSAEEAGFYSKVDGRTPLNLLCKSGPGGMRENARTLYTFFCLGFLRPAAVAGARRLHWKTEGGSLG